MIQAVSGVVSGSCSNRGDVYAYIVVDMADKNQLIYMNKYIVVAQ